MNHMLDPGYQSKKASEAPERMCEFSVSINALHVLDPIVLFVSRCLLNGNL